MSSTGFPVLTLLAGRHKRVAMGSPWVFSNEIAMDQAAKSLPPGSLVNFRAHDGSSLGTGTFNPHSLIAGRLLSRSPVVTIDTEFFVRLIRRALALRDKLVGEPFYRLVHAEADGLPGLIVDRFGPHLGVQVNTAGMELLWPQIRSALIEVLSPETIVLHNDSPSRKMEGLSLETSLDLGKLSGPIEVRENGLAYYANLLEGQKTGWYFDQRDNHALVARYSKGKTVLDLYCHAGGFGLLAANQGASKVMGVDASAPALELAAMAAKKNKLDKKCFFQRTDAFEYLENLSAAKECFDIVIADPPPFVRAKKDLASGSRGYRKLARLSAMVTARGGLLYIASCSHNMELSLFAEEVAKGLQEARRQGRILFTTFAAPDHPVHPNLPESSYLKGFLIALD
jgi:23S rRNA (cytosine1962-C5)-methyltransferase